MANICLVLHKLGVLYFLFFGSLSSAITVTSSLARKDNIIVNTLNTRYYNSNLAHPLLRSSKSFDRVSNKSFVDSQISDKRESNLENVDIESNDIDNGSSSNTADNLSKNHASSKKSSSNNDSSKLERNLNPSGIKLQRNSNSDVSQLQRNSNSDVLQLQRNSNYDSSIEISNVKSKNNLGGEKNDELSYEYSTEEEECSGDDSSSTEDREESYSSGVDTIISLSKEPLPVVKSPTKTHTKTSKHERKSDGIDIKYLQDLFNKKNVREFEKNMTILMKERFFKTLRKSIYNKESKLKMFEDFETLDPLKEKDLLKLVDQKIKHEEESIRYNISFPMFYQSVGTITLPFDDLVEPFQAWYAGELNMSRIDYYYGMDKTYQRGDIGSHGVVLKITPAHWKKEGDMDDNTISCWYKEENKWSKRRGQTVVPMNIKKFDYVGLFHFNGVPAHKFKYEKQFVNKNNTYILHVTQSLPHKPLRYEMKGYDHLLRSHYDHYIIDYLSFEPWDFDYRVLQIPKEYKCYKKLEKMKSHFEANPMMDFLHEEDDFNRETELNRTYSYYKDKHDKNYIDGVENHKRKNIFRHNLRYIHSHNRAKLNFTLDVNHLSDISDEEFEMMKGQPDIDEPKIQKELTGIPQLRIEIPKGPLPENLDWRDYGAVTKVHSQSFCASCWAFSAVGAIEGAYALKYGNSTDLSVQELIDCSWAYDNNGCRGGWSWRAFKFVSDHGLATSKSYGKYLGQEGYCHCDKKDNCEGIDKVSFRTIQKHDKEKAKVAVAMYGPGSISVFSGRKTFKFYSSGIYDDPKCGHKTDHAVLLVGYGIEPNNNEYWLIKNSWGNYWGNNGYIKISTKKDLCGVLQNGALMVSLEDWKTVDAKAFPFKSMTKKTSTVKFNPSDEMIGFQDGIDLFTTPQHVVAYRTNMDEIEKR